MINDERKTVEIKKSSTFLIKFSQMKVSKTKLQNNFRHRSVVLSRKIVCASRIKSNFPPKDKEIVTLRSKIRNWSSENVQRKVKWVEGAHVDAVMMLFMTQFQSLKSIKKVLADGKFDSYFLFLFVFPVDNSVFAFFMWTTPNLFRKWRWRQTDPNRLLMWNVLM